MLDLTIGRRRAQRPRALTHRQREILALRESGLKLREIAERLGISVQGVWDTLRRAQRATS